MMLITGNIRRSMHIPAMQHTVGVAKEPQTPQVYDAIQRSHVLILYTVTGKLQRHIVGSKRYIVVV